MSNNVMERINTTGLVPVVVLDDPSTAVDAAKAMVAGGVDIMEITLRTAAGIESIKLVAEGCPEMLVGAGTVLTLEQCVQAVENGAKFIVSPGTDPEIVDYCIEAGVAVCPGCVTPTEIMYAMKKGINVVKFFPANVYGGIKAIKSLAAPFGSVQFIPTGGVDLSNLADFVKFPIFAVGGGWLSKLDAINSGNFAAITDVCSKSIDVLLGLKENGNAVILKDLLVKGGEVTTISIPRTTSQLIRRGFEAKVIKDGMEFVKDSISIFVKSE